MAIYAPGLRPRGHGSSGVKKRSPITMLSLTAMVDMFTVLAVFLLQNYGSDGVLEIKDKVELPKANAVKEIKPAHVVVLSKEQLSLDDVPLATFAQIAAQPEMKIEILHTQLLEMFKLADQKRQGLGGQIREAVDATKPEEMRTEPEDDKRVTVQADKSVDFLTVKKVLTTLTEAGASQINFAVIKENKQQ